MKEEIDLKPYEENIVQKRYEIIAILKNIHGQYAKRVHKISEVVFDETITLTDEEKEEMKKRTAKRSRPETVATFPKDKEGYLVIPLGGNHGYIMGALKKSVVDLYKDKLKDRKWEGYGILTFVEHGLQVTPQWVRVGKEFSKDSPKVHMVKSGAWGGGAIFTYFDYIKEAKIKFIIEQMNTKIPEKILMEMLAYVQRLGLGPKGRGELKILKVVKTKG